MKTSESNWCPLAALSCVKRRKHAQRESALWRRSKEEKEEEGEARVTSGVIPIAEVNFDGGSAGSKGAWRAHGALSRAHQASRK
jgi:hypothetical protein